FVWCYLGNFGGNTMLAGNLKEIAGRIDTTFKKNRANLAGVGATLEGLDCNPMMYEFVFERPWLGDSLNVNKWVTSWADRRLGQRNSNTEKAWQLLLNTVYNVPAELGQGTLTNSKPVLEGFGNWTTNPHIGYKNTDLLEAWRLLLKVKPAPNVMANYDIVNIGRQVLGNYFEVL